ncbi:protein Hikeshi-like [Lingula anatina]|uniref:Protein Hikeshi-like n=1 Tax=Lingula anatina TaxID=7574 RepID=A0A1S3HI37_LINAN|nr:protein Hikeshi-like [Lingula anatina]|eukprot:XP_013384654.1 protein Hikeshi-like [Lingula anatina]
MFGILAAGRLVQTEFQQISETQFLFNITDADNVNHIVVFMTGQVPFPDGMGGAVYFCWPNPSGPSWMLLGHISNAKPSAIFKISGLKSGDNAVLNPFGQSSQQPSHNAQIGISVEPLEQLSQQTPATNTSLSTLNTMVAFSQKMLENFFNYASSFAVNQAQMVPNPSETFVPLSTLQKWYENFQKRMETNPNFWKT